MALHALDDLDDALDVTRGFLTPVERGTWLKLALVALFVGGPGTSAASFSFGGGPDAGAASGDVPSVDLGPDAWLVIGAVVAVLALFVLAITLVGSILEFVFVESLRNEAVTLRRYWRRRWRQGVRLFGFRLLLGLFLFAAAALLAAPFVLPLLGIAPVGGGLAFAALLVLVPLFVVLAALIGLVHGFTTVFVVPVMILEDCGVLAGWRRLWPTITAHWRQYLAYAVVGFFLSIAVGVVVGMATGIGALALLIPFGILFAVCAAVFVFASELVGIALFVAVAVLYVLAIVVLAALVQVPVKAYVRYYALLVLGDVEPALDVIPEQRAAVREPTEPTGR